MKTRRKSLNKKIKCKTKNENTEDKKLEQTKWEGNSEYAKSRHVS